MRGIRAIGRRLWRQITWRLLVSYLVVGWAAVGVVGFGGALFASHYFGPHISEQFRHDLTQALLTAAVVSVIASVGVSLFVSRRIVEPIRQVMHASRRIADGNYGERVPINDDFEITELAASFNRMAEALEQTERQRQMLIADVAHELRTPLTSIKGYMEALMDGVMPGDTETYTLVYTEADRLYRLVRDLQELSRLEAGQMALNPAPVDIGDLVRSVLGRVRPQFDAKGVHISSAVAPDVGYVWGDADRLFQVLLNLLNNALQYTPAGGRVSVAAYGERERICLAVQDTGTGIAPGEIGHIFQRFYRVDKSRSRLAGGTGIGLTIVKHIVEAHGGSIAVSSTPDLGSTFTVALPLYNAAAQQSAMPLETLVVQH